MAKQNWQDHFNKFFVNQKYLNWININSSIKVTFNPISLLNLDSILALEKIFAKILGSFIKIESCQVKNISQKDSTR